MTAGQWLVATLVTVFCGAAAATACDALFDRRPQFRIAVVVIVATATALALRLIFFPPVLLHAGFHGGALVDAILAFPAPALHRAEYGPASFWILGALARVSGSGFHGIAVIDQVIGVATLPILGALAARWSGRPWALVVVVLLGALHPVLARVAASEDAHTLALLFGAVALLGFDRYGRRPGYPALVMATAATVLMLLTRQTFLAWAPIGLAVVVVRGGRAVLRRIDFLIASGLVLATLVVRTAATIATDPDQHHVLLPQIVTRDPLPLLLHHPLIRPSLAAILLPLTVLGAVLLWRQRAIGRLWLLGALGYFVLTLSFGFPVPSVEFGFRVPLAGLLLIAAGVGGEWLLARIPIRPVAVVAALGLAASPLVLPGWGPARRLNPATEEADAVRRLAAALPTDRGIAIVELSHREPAASWHLPRFALAEAGVRARYVHPDDVVGDQPRYFLAGLGCRAFSVGELASTRNLGEVLYPALTGDLPPDTRPPPAMRPECEALLRDATPIGTPIRIPVSDQIPFAMYAEREVPIQFYRLR